MVISHFPAMLLFAFLVSVVFGVIARNTTRERILYGAKSFALFVGIALLIGWLMYPFPRPWLPQVKSQPSSSPNH
jgi:putative Mn2+ efflux pump MntP